MGKEGDDRDERDSLKYTEPPASTAPAISLNITEIACGLSGFSWTFTRAPWLVFSWISVLLGVLNVSRGEFI